MKTTETVLESGLYATECCSEELVFDIGDLFRRCPKCHELCEWELQEELVRPDNLKSDDGIAA
jgi:hypothetical protein